jgi:pilus assembly protein CpaE
MSEPRLKFKVLSGGAEPETTASRTRVGYVEGAIGGPERVASLAALFPNVEFAGVGAEWPDRPPAGLTALIVGAVAADADSVLKRLAARPQGLAVIIALRDADVATTRRLMRGGAADILPAPVSEAALALSLERHLAGAETAAPRAAAGRVIALLKAGGGVGATAIGTQVAAILASRAGTDGGVCFADLDLQFGQGALYLDLADAMTLTDILGGGGALEEAPLGTAIARHRSGARLLAAPRELAPLETVGPNDIDGLIKALRRDFALTLLDLPSSWTAWTNRALQLCDHIVLITNLSVPHIQLVKRQLKVMATQHLDGIPLTLVCNRLSADQQAILSLKTAEKALGRPFDLVIPEDRKLMNDASAQGCEVSAIRTGSKLEKAIRDLANAISPTASVGPERRARRWL